MLFSFQDHRGLYVSNFAGKFSYTKKQIKVERKDVASILSWREGYFTFKSQSLNTILSKLSKYYKIQFIKGLDEKVLPDVRLTRSRDGSTGTATFRFKNANILDKSLALSGEITGMYMIDKEGILETRDVSAQFINGKPQAVESIYIMKSPEAWDRFMRFMKRYGESNGLVFTKA